MFRLNPETLKLEDYYTPPNWDYVYKRDFDITVSATLFEYGDDELMVIAARKASPISSIPPTWAARRHHKNLYTTPLLSNEEEWFEAKGLWGAFSHYIDDQGEIGFTFRAGGRWRTKRPSFR